MVITNWFIAILVLYFIPTRCFLFGVYVGDETRFHKVEKFRETLTYFIAFGLLPELLITINVLQWVFERAISFLDCVQKMIEWILDKIAGN